MNDLNDKENSGAPMDSRDENNEKEVQLPLPEPIPEPEEAEPVSVSAPVIIPDVYGDEIPEPPSAPDPEREEKMKRLLIKIGAAALVLAVAFAGAFYAMYFVCRTALLGDSEFFAAFMAKWAGVTQNRVEVDYITGEYRGDNIELADKMLSSTLLIRTVSRDEKTGNLTVLSHGSGVVYSTDSGSGVTLAVTNYHVIENGGDILVETQSGKRYNGKVKASDSLTDLAVIEFTVEEQLTQASHADSDKLKAGQSAAVAGNPLGTGFAVSFGYIACPSIITGEIDGPEIQIDISVNPGNSGGGVFDSQGNLIGIVVSKASGENIDGIGYAIPVNRVNEVVSDLLKFGYVQGRPALNITVINIITPAQYSYYSQNELSGHLHETVQSNYKYGVYIIESRNGVLKAGDRLVSIDGISIVGNESVTKAISKLSPGTAVKVKVERSEIKDGAVVYTQSTLDVVLGTRDWAD